MVEVDVASSLATQVATVKTLLKTIALDNGALNGIANQMNAMNQVATISRIQCHDPHVRHVPT